VDLISLAQQRVTSSTEHQVALLDLQLERLQERVRMTVMTPRREQEVLQVLQAQTKQRQNLLRIADLEWQIATAARIYQQKRQEPGSAEQQAWVTEEYYNQVNALSQQITQLSEANDLLAQIEANAAKLREVQITRTFAEDPDFSVLHENRPPMRLSRRWVMKVHETKEVFGLDLRGRHG
jgi:hypothetical protein